MKILFLCDFEGNLGNAIRISRIYDRLKQIGHEVQFRNVHSAYNPKMKMLLNPGVLASIAGHKLRLENSELVSFEARMMCAEKVVRSVLKAWGPDLIWCETVIPAAGAIEAVKQAIPVVADVHGLASAEYEEATASNGPDAKTLSRIKGAEERLCSNSFRVIVVSSPMKDYLVEAYRVSPEKVCTVPNGSDVRKERAKYSEPHKVVYGGILGAWEGIDVFLDLAKMDQRHLFYLLGGGPLKKHVLTRIRKEGIPVVYLGYLDYASAIQRFTEMTVGIALIVNTFARRVASPVKIYDYLSCGLPVITSDVGEWSQMISKNDCGFVTKTSEAKELMQCLDRLDRATWEEMASNGMRVIERDYNWNILLNSVNDILSQCHR
jgi:glycosyltransferase involved in cell wall biosynthesis